MKRSLNITFKLPTKTERPLLLHRVKFDIRQWFLVSDWNPLTLWIYKDSYLRLCSQEFTYDTKHESVHLSNVAVQQNYLNGKRSSRLPANNFMTSEQFKEYLSSIGNGGIWDSVTYPAMKAAIISTLASSVDVLESRKNAFELYGADFILTEDFKPWLLEINSSPGMAATSPEKVKLCSQVVDDLVKVVLDRRENKACDTGRFELVNKEICIQPMSNFKCVDTKFMVEGQKVKKADLQKYALFDAKHSKSDKKIAEKHVKDKLNEETRNSKSNCKIKENSPTSETENKITSAKNSPHKEQWTDIVQNANL